MKNAQVHRFGNTVAVSLPGTGQTVYLTEKEARQLAKAVLSGAQDIKRQPRFSESEFSTVHIDLSNPLRN